MLSSVIGGHEVFVGGFRSFGSGDRGRDQDAVAEGGPGARGEGKIQLFLAIAEDFLAERIGSKKAVTAGMPISRKAGIGGMIEDGDGHGEGKPDRAGDVRFHRRSEENREPRGA